MSRPRHALTALAVAVAAAGVPADAAPCRAVVTDLVGDTYAWSPVRYYEPGADIVSLLLRADSKTLHIVTTLADVDAPVLTAPLGRQTTVLFTLGEESFLVSHADAVDGVHASLSVVMINRARGQGASAMAASGREVADLESQTDIRTNEIRVRVPLAELRKHTSSVRAGATVVVHDVQTWDRTGLDDAHTGGTIDLTMPNEGTWRFGSCA